jgi:hypothetical protein
MNVMDGRSIKHSKWGACSGGKIEVWNAFEYLVGKHVFRFGHLVVYQFNFPPVRQLINRLMDLLLDSI